MRYVVSRNCNAQDILGRDIKIAVAVIESDLGRGLIKFETVAIPELMIRFAGEGIIELAVRSVAGVKPSSSALFQSETIASRAAD